MLDILQMRIHIDDFDRLRRCQIAQRQDCQAAFTVSGTQAIWPLASWDETPAEERINVREWFPVLDRIADEFLIWRPDGGCFFVFRDRVIYRIAENDERGVMFLQLELNRPMAVLPRPAESERPRATGIAVDWHRRRNAWG